MQDTWNLRNNSKKSYLKIHVTVNAKSKKILSMNVIADDEHVRDSKTLPELVDDLIKSNNIIAIGKLFADRASYDSNDIFRCLTDKGIFWPSIKE